MFSLIVLDKAEIVRVCNRISLRKCPVMYREGSVADFILPITVPFWVLSFGKWNTPTAHQFSLYSLSEVNPTPFGCETSKAFRKEMMPDVN